MNEGINSFFTLLLLHCLRRLTVQFSSQVNGNGLGLCNAML